MNEGITFQPRDKGIPLLEKAMLRVHVTNPVRFCAGQWDTYDRNATAEDLGAILEQHPELWYPLVAQLARSGPDEGRDVETLLSRLAQAEAALQVIGERGGHPGTSDVALPAAEIGSLSAASSIAFAAVRAYIAKVALQPPLAEVTGVAGWIREAVVNMGVRDREDFPHIPDASDEQQEAEDTLTDWTIQVAASAAELAAKEIMGKVLARLEHLRSDVEAAVRNRITDHDRYDDTDCPQPNGLTDEQETANLQAFNWILERAAREAEIAIADTFDTFAPRESAEH